MVAGVVRGQIPYLEEHIRGKKEIYERYKEGLKGLPAGMNPYDEENSVPNHWLSCLLIEPEGMACQERGDCDTLYIPEHGKSCPTEILEAVSSIHAEGRPIWKPMHMQPIYQKRAFVTREGMTKADAGKGADGMLLDVGRDIFHRGVCLPSDNKMTAEQQERVIEVVRACFE